MTDNIKNASICTFTGKRFFLLDPVIKDIDIEDIAHSLANQCRWTGHCKYHYSVAQHSYYCSLIVPKRDALYALMHDASEAYISDLSRPLKHYTPAGTAYMLQETIVMNAIKQRFGMPSKEPASVKLADNQMLLAERGQLMPDTEWENKWWLANTEECEVPNIKIRPWSTRHAKQMFLKRFNELYKRGRR